MLFHLRPDSDSKQSLNRLRHVSMHKPPVGMYTCMCNLHWSSTHVLRRRWVQNCLIFIVLWSLLRNYWMLNHRTWPLSLWTNAGCGPVQKTAQTCQTLQGWQLWVCLVLAEFCKIQDFVASWQCGGDMGVAWDQRWQVFLGVCCLQLPAPGH